MTDNKWYITRGAAEKIPVWLQRLIWFAVSEDYDKDYLQVFEARTVNGETTLIHSQEEPPFKKTYNLKVVNEPVDLKIYVIDDGLHITMLLAEEY